MVLIILFIFVVCSIDVHLRKLLVKIAVKFPEIIHKCIQIVVHATNVMMMRTAISLNMDRIHCKLLSTIFRSSHQIHEQYLNVIYSSIVYVCVLITSSLSFRWLYLRSAAWVELQNKPIPIHAPHTQKQHSFIQWHSKAIPKLEREWKQQQHYLQHFVTNSWHID